MSKTDGAEPPSEGSLSLLSSSLAIHTRNLMWLKSRGNPLNPALLKHAKHWKSMLEVLGRLHSPTQLIEMIQKTSLHAPSCSWSHEAMVSFAEGQHWKEVDLLEDLWMQWCQKCGWTALPLPMHFKLYTIAWCYFLSIYLADIDSLGSQFSFPLTATTVLPQRGALCAHTQRKVSPI